MKRRSMVNVSVIALALGAALAMALVAGCGSGSGDQPTVPSSGTSPALTGKPRLILFTQPG